MFGVGGSSGARPFSHASHSNPKHSLPSRSQEKLLQALVNKLGPSARQMTLPQITVTPLDKKFERSVGCDMKSLTDELNKVFQEKSTALNDQLALIRQGREAFEDVFQEIQEIQGALNQMRLEKSPILHQIMDQHGDLVSHAPFEIICQKGAQVVPPFSLEVMQLAAPVSFDTSPLLVDEPLGELGLEGTLTIQRLKGAVPEGAPQTVALTPHMKIEGFLSALNRSGAIEAAHFITYPYGPGESAEVILTLTAKEPGISFVISDDCHGNITRLLGIGDPKEATLAHLRVNGRASISLSNDVADCIPGRTIRLHAVTSAPIRVMMGLDEEKLISFHREVIEALNGLKAKVIELTTTSDGTPPLIKNTSFVKGVIRRLETFFLDRKLLVGDYGWIYRDGVLSFDAEKFRQILRARPEEADDFLTKLHNQVFGVFEAHDTQHRKTALTSFQKQEDDLKKNHGKLEKAVQGKQRELKETRAKLGDMEQKMRVLDMLRDVNSQTT